MKRNMLILAVGILVVSVTPQVAQAGPWKVTFWQAGVPTTTVQAGVEFQIRGEGFHNNVAPIKVCLFDNQCQLATPERDGNFMVVRTITTPGDYEIRVFQAQNAHLREWNVKASGPMKVTN